MPVDDRTALGRMVTRMLQPPDDPQPVACACGHLKRVHYGRHNEGTCLGAHRNEKGKEAVNTVCACAAFEEKA